MDLDYDTLVAFSKSWGLFYLMGFFLCVVVYAFWPSNRKHFTRAKTSILDQDDKPWR
ncbi:cbb3-type cytochrome c oxidase subunit 3 [Aminobacter aganoensis]|uniref:Cytochrome c oxidase cbb3-type subunit 4 n=1 Tax=Aminobacter aganoensis TaxID=83264 RepID=A0A7X0F9Y4_9HYPH|nr:cbb3-type cytochrome c oxidase subunit 3 [Aminobacter aganoensis]MBB6355852.1 cytochrome c oxidase cbb3-type subunit 4 [Aminobacter aganoensis]